jgi:hypothetical protein
MVRDVSLLEEGIQPLILTTSISLNRKKLLVKQPFNKTLKFSKFLKYLRLLFEEVDLGKFTEIINKTHVIFISPNRGKAGPHT